MLSSAMPTLNTPDPLAVQEGYELAFWLSYAGPAVDSIGPRLTLQAANGGFWYGMFENRNTTAFSVGADGVYLESLSIAKQKVFVGPDSSLAYTAPGQADQADGKPSDFDFTLSWPVSGKQDQTLYLQMAWDLIFSVCSTAPNQGPYKLYVTRWGQPMKPGLHCPGISPPRANLGLPPGFVAPFEYSAVEVGGGWANASTSQF
ncbi:MAG: hypothetical protein M1838_005101 [Thelocarpon superellum]|nr:MAG: hypothetical protein M1838_005101 [Thelocarpon superellum]